jgi:hypothetical protein
MRKRGWVLMFFLSLAAGLGGWFRAPLMAFWHASSGGLELGWRQGIQPDPTKYRVLTEDLERWRKNLAERYRKAKTAEERAGVEGEARAVLEQALPAMMRCWLGTPWDFNGTAKGPGEGKIACGYFVATVLKDAGFQVDRYQLAQQPSGNILHTFLAKEATTLTVGQDYQVFATDLEKREPGVYIVGLDTHVGFIIVAGQTLNFIHSSGSQPWCVVDENRNNAGVLQRSSWRMLGNLTADPGVLKRWLKAEKIVVKGA